VRRRTGFTLLEVMVAIFVLGTVVGALLQLVQVHLTRLGEARRELEGARLAEARLREIQADATGGTLPELGRTEGEFEEHDYLLWELVVEPASIPLPDEMADQPPPSGVFSDGRTFIPTGAPAPGEEDEPALLRVSLRVFHEDVEDPESVIPYVLYVVGQPELTGLGSQPESESETPEAPDGGPSPGQRP
jgi:prepilin-type N-terminal cleavage/methylation domain-containing protein